MNNTDSLNLIAQKIINQVKPKNNENFGAIITILMVISIILTLVRVIQECNKKQVTLFDKRKKYDYFGAEIRSLSFKKTWYTKLTAKRIIRKHLNNKAVYNEYGSQLLDSIFNTGESLTDDEIITLVETSNV
jgi:hypothetical protein